MCCFSGPVRSVGETRIFARDLPGDEQVLVYTMRVELASELAMVLPLPVPPRPADDAVHFVDLSGAADLFDRIERLFPVSGFAPAPLARGVTASAAPLKVHAIGDFEASFVPTLSDFKRLDRRFRLSDSVWEGLPEYQDFGFAVFKLAPVTRGMFGTAPQKVHPMAFRFPRRDPNELFFPTVHVHDGKVAKVATFDHALYCQPRGALQATLPWETSFGSPRHVLEGARTADSVDPDAVIFRSSLWGPLPNRDVRLSPPTLDLTRLEGSGEHHHYRARCGAAYATESGTEPHRTWHHNARHSFIRIQHALAEELPALCAARRMAWGLCRLTPDLAPHFMNGPQLWSGTDYMHGSATPGPGPCAIRFTAFSDRVEPQDVTLAFGTPPDRALTDTIRAELAALLDRAVA
jgi:hypothetical protein